VEKNLAQDNFPNHDKINYAVRHEIRGEGLGKIAAHLGLKLQEFLRVRESQIYKEEYANEKERRFRHIDNEMELGKVDVLREINKGAGLGARYLRRTVEPGSGASSKERLRASELLVNWSASTRNGMRMLPENQHHEGPNIQVNFGIQVIADAVEQAKKLNEFVLEKKGGVYQINDTDKP
jgi:hypothetical protein